mmetsp:Transcript_20108/g.80210  ORF Transcript_20108/g.80210 Transcript_20108/m.80210 type:complete len:218 (+) Transcript_20108:2063-2716(+)
MHIDMHWVTSAASQSERAEVDGVAVAVVRAEEFAVDLGDAVGRVGLGDLGLVALGGRAVDRHRRREQDAHIMRPRRLQDRLDGPRGHVEDAAVVGVRDARRREVDDRVDGVAPDDVVDLVEPARVELDERTDVVGHDGRRDDVRRDDPIAPVAPPELGHDGRPELAERPRHENLGRRLLRGDRRPGFFERTPEGSAARRRPAPQRAGADEDLGGHFP